MERERGGGGGGGGVTRKCLLEGLGRGETLIGGLEKKKQKRGS